MHTRWVCTHANWVTFSSQTHQKLPISLNINTFEKIDELQKLNMDLIAILDEYLSTNISMVFKYILSYVKHVELIAMYIFRFMLYVERVKLVENTYYVAFSMSTCLLKDGACGLDLISPNQMCNVLWTLGRNDSQFCFVSRTSPASTMSFNFAFCFFHVESANWLKLYALHTSTDFIPHSNLFKIWSFSLSVWSTCWHLGLEQDIFLCNVLKCTGT